MKSLADVEEFLVDRLHALLGQRAGVLDRLPALAVGLALQDAARAELLLEFRVLGIVLVLRLLLGVKVIEVAEELVEAVHRRQMLVAVAEVVLAELSGRVALRLQHLGDGGVFRRGRAPRRQADLGEAGADRRLAGEEGGASGGAALLRVPVGEQRAFSRDAVDVGRAVAHHAEIVAAGIEPADVVTHDEEDVGFLVCEDRLPDRGKNMKGSVLGDKDTSRISGVIPTVAE